MVIHYAHIRTNCAPYSRSSNTYIWTDCHTRAHTNCVRHSRSTNSNICSNCHTHACANYHVSATGK